MRRRGAASDATLSGGGTACAPASASATDSSAVRKMILAIRHAWPRPSRPLDSILARASCRAARYRTRGTAIKLAPCASLDSLVTHPGGADRPLHSHRSQYAVDLGHRAAAGRSARSPTCWSSCCRLCFGPRHAPRRARRAQGARSGAGPASLREPRRADRRCREPPALCRRARASGPRRGSRSRSTQALTGLYARIRI